MVKLCRKCCRHHFPGDEEFVGEVGSQLEALQKGVKLLAEDGTVIVDTSDIKAEHECDVALHLLDEFLAPEEDMRDSQAYHGQGQ